VEAPRPRPGGFSASLGLKQQLLKAAEATGIADNVERAKRAYGG
jgi:hypothetical protein